nr:hypothetical protein [Tanacetum cinerariifolium]GEX27182.1 hypothetical protein [Tanacetum cinerariifolium]
MAWFKELKIHLDTLHNNRFSMGRHMRPYEIAFRVFFREERNLLLYLEELDKLIDEKLLKYKELRMKKREVQAIKEIEKWLKEREIQQQESLVTEGTTLKANLSTDGTTLDASLVTKGIAINDNLVAKESAYDSITSSEQLDESSSS